MKQQRYFLQSKLCLIFLIILLSILLVPQAFAQETFHVKLLAVQEKNGVMEGSPADLYLELIPGSGRVFLDTSPVTKMDTQISTRFAKEIACSHFKLECDKYDFIFTIRANSNIIGGPSAGAAIAALTTIAILDLPHDESKAITATINSGATIGPVGGVQEKIQAAERAGISKVLLAKGSLPVLNISNDNQNSTSQNNTLENLTKNVSIEIREVATLDEVIEEFTGRQLNHKKPVVTENKEYTKIMKNLQSTLCERTNNIQNEIEEQNLMINGNQSNKIEEKKRQAINATLQNDYYSAASFCFGVNIDLKRNYYQIRKPQRLAVAQLFKLLEKKNIDLFKELEKQEIQTISDLQTFMVVRERIQDVTDQIKDYEQKQQTASLDDIYSILAYAEERYFSAKSWQQFFSMDGKRFVLDDTALENSCRQKISEADERHQYASLFLSAAHLNHVTKKIATTYKALENKEYELCLITATQAKAEANAIISSLGVTENSLDDYTNTKKLAVERVISDNSQQGIFPILGYSYYQYAQSLKNNRYHSLLYLEYALEMSDLQMYFPENKNYMQPFSRININDPVFLTAQGFIIGVLATTLFFVFRDKKHKKDSSKALKKNKSTNQRTRQKKKK